MFWRHLVLLFAQLLAMNRGEEEGHARLRRFGVCYRPDTKPVWDVPAKSAFLSRQSLSLGNASKGLGLCDLTCARPPQDWPIYMALSEDGRLYARKPRPPSSSLTDKTIRGQVPSLTRSKSSFYKLDTPEDKPILTIEQLEATDRFEDMLHVFPSLKELPIDSDMIPYDVLTWPNVPLLQRDLKKESEDWSRSDPAVLFTQTRQFFNHHRPL